MLGGHQRSVEVRTHLLQGQQPRLHHQARFYQEAALRADSKTSLRPGDLGCLAAAPHQPGRFSLEFEELIPARLPCKTDQQFNPRKTRHDCCTGVMRLNGQWPDAATMYLLAGTKQSGGPGGARCHKN